MSITMSDTWVVDAITTKGAPVTLISDPTGDYFVVEQPMFLGGEPMIVAHRIGPGDRLKDGITRFTILEPPPHERL